MAAQHEEEVLGKAYDSRLMKRLLRYLRPYRGQVAVALVSIVLKAVADVLGPFGRNQEIAALGAWFPVCKPAGGGGITHGCSLPRVD